MSDVLWEARLREIAIEAIQEAGLGVMDEKGYGYWDWPDRVPDNPDACKAVEIVVKAIKAAIAEKRFRFGPAAIALPMQLGDAIAVLNPGCLCGRGEWCEKCSSKKEATDAPT